MASYNVTSEATTLSESTENGTTESVTERYHHEDDVTFADELPYVIGGVTVAFIILAVVLAVFLWKKARPCRQSKWDIEHSPGKCVVAVRFKNTQSQRGKQLSKTEKRGRRRERTAPARNAHPFGPGVPGGGLEGIPPLGMESAAGDSAPDIITAHDSDPVCDAAELRRTVGATPGHVTPANSQSGCSAGAANQWSRLAAGASVTTVVDSEYDRLGQKRSPRTPAYSSGRHQRALKDGAPLPPPPPPPPPRPRMVRDPDGSIRILDTKNGPEVQTPEDADACGLRVLSSLDSLKTALEKLPLRNYGPGTPLLCRLTVVGVMDNGRPVPVSPAAEDSDAVFLVQPGANREREGKTSVAAGFQPQARGGAAIEGKADYGREFSVVQDPGSLPELAGKQTVVPVPSRRESGSAEVTYNSGRRSSLPPPRHHPPDCPRVTLRRDSDNKVTALQGVGKATHNISSLPTLCSKEDPALAVLKVDYTRSLSSPQSSQRAGPQGGKPPDRKLDAATLQARIQQEMRALGFVDEGLTPDPDVGTGTDPRAAAEPRFRFAVQGAAPSSGTASQNEYFILEPDPDAEEEDPAECGHSPTAGHLPVPAAANPLTFTAPSSGEADPGGKLRYQRKSAAPGLPPPRLPRRAAARVVGGHTRSRSETPVPQLDKARGEGEKGEEEERGPVIVSLKKLRSAGTERRPAPPPPPGHPQRPSFRPRIRSEPGCS